MTHYNNGNGNGNGRQQARLDLWDDIAGEGNRESFAHLGDSFGPFGDEEATLEPGERRPQRRSDEVLDYSVDSSFEEFADEAHSSPWNGEPIVHQEETRDFPVSVDEAFGGVGAVSDRFHQSYDTPAERGAWADLTPERDEARIARYAAEDQMDMRESADQQYERQQFGFQPVGFERQRPTGRMAPSSVEPDPQVTADRDQATGRFVSPDRENPGIARKRDRGIFTEER